MVSPITSKRELLIDALRGLGPGWHSRSDLARAFGKKRLNPVETAALDHLAATDEIERQSAPGGHDGVMQWVYRLKDESGND